MGSSKDLAKHIRVVVRSEETPIGGPGRREVTWVHVFPNTPCSCVQCDGMDLTPKIQDLKPQCIVFLNIPR